MIRHTPLVLREAILSIRRKPLTSLMSALTVAMALALGMTLAFLYFRAQLSLAGLRSHLVVEAFLDPSASNEQMQQFAKQSVAPLPEVKSMETITKEAALAEYKRSTGEDAASVLGFSPLPCSIRITLQKPTTASEKNLEQALKKFAVVREIQFDSQTLKSLESRSAGLTLLAVILGCLLTTTTIVFLFTSTRLAIHTRRSAIRTMHLLGAPRTTIEVPFIVEGMLAGTSGGLIAGGCFLLLLHYILPNVSAEFVSSHSVGHLLPFVLLIPMIAGLLLGSISSVLSTLLATRSLRLRLW
jgi:cell division transport system permease protein